MNHNLHYVGASLPTNVHQAIGFYPLLPQQLPHRFSLGAFNIWNPKGGKPLLHAQYGIWISGADGSSGLFDVLMIDEVAAPLTLLQYLASDTPLHISKQTVTHVGQMNATLYFLESASQATQLHQLLWKANGITLRVTAVTKGTLSFIYHETKEQIQFKQEISDEMLTDLARSIASDAHCG